MFTHASPVIRILQTARPAAAHWITALVVSAVGATPALAVISNIVGQTNRRPLPNPPAVVQALPGAASNIVTLMWTDPPGAGEDGFAIQGRRSGEVGWDMLQTITGAATFADIELCTLGEGEFRVAAVQYSSGGAARYSAWTQARESVDLVCLPTPVVAGVSLLPPARYDVRTWARADIPMIVSINWDGENENVSGLQLEWRSIDTEWRWQAMEEDAVDGDGVPRVLVGNRWFIIPHEGTTGADLPCGTAYDVRIRAVGHAGGRSFYSDPVYFTLTLSCADRRTTINLSPTTSALEPRRVFVRGGW